MSLTVRQVAQISSKFKEQLDAYQADLDNNDAIAERLKDMFSSTSPQLDALSVSVRERQKDLSIIESMHSLSSDQLAKIQKENRFVDDLAVQASRYCESLVSSNSYAKVMVVPSVLSEQNIGHLETRAKDLDRSVSLTNDMILRLSDSNSQSSFNDAVDDLTDALFKKDQSNPLPALQ